jgi:large subunit ribosomal protein L19
VLKTIESKFLREGIPEFKTGDNIRVHVKIREGDKERIQIFQGDVIGRKGSGVNACARFRPALVSKGFSPFIRRISPGFN